jgi:hypothetical protein
MSTIAAAATTPWTATCAASSRHGATGVVESRRRMPFSR